MRPLSLGAVALLVLAVALVYYVFFSLQEAHVASLVPEDMAWGVFYRSVDEVREAYEHPLARRDADPGRLRLGIPVNVPGLNGISQQRPFGSYVTREFQEVFLVPFTDFSAFEEAFETSQEDVNLRAPRRVARNYLSVSRAPVVPRKGPDNRLVLRGLEHPISLVGHPHDARTVKQMLGSLLARELRQGGAPRIPLLAAEVARMPEPVADRISRECRDLVVGIEPGAEARAPVRVAVEATLRADSLLRGAAPLAADAGLGGVVACFPRETVLLAGAVLEAAGWKELGVAASERDGALACGILDTQYRARRYTVLFISRNGASGAELATNLFGAGLAYQTLPDNGTTVHTAVLADVPERLADVLRASVRDDAPPVYVSHASEAGLSFCAVGSQAEATVRHALACRRGAEELSVARSPLLGDHGDCVTGAPVLVALASPEGLRAFRYAMPLFEIVSLAQPAAITAAAHIDGDRLVGEMRIQRETAPRNGAPNIGDGVIKPNK